jgi:hypothetical protein
MKLPIKAVSERDGQRFEHDVTLEDGILRIEGTPGHWHVETLCRNDDSPLLALAIDAGRDWVWINVAEVLNWYRSRYYPPQRTITVTTRPCWHCHNTSEITVDLEAFRKWSGGAKIQDAFPHMSQAEREHLKSGIHPACWEEMFGPNPHATNDHSPH